jgi:L-asparaginase II
VAYQPILEVTRGGIVESVHHGAVAVADAAGRLVAWWGDPATITFLRSSAKPFQALPLLESGAADHYRLTPRQLAVICASHSGTDDHVRTVESIQAAVGVSEAELRCGAHPPFDLHTAQRLRQAGEIPTPNRHNCSGKHSGMLAQARYRNEVLEGYFEAAHPVQQRILAALAAMCDMDPASVHLGIDGCSVPTFAVPLQAAATAFARLSDPSALGAARARACRRIYDAMSQHPDMVGGSDRFDTALMIEGQGRLVAKGGAEGYQGIALAPGACGKGSPALGIALKISDGDLGRRSDRPPGHRARSRVVASVLEQLGAVHADARQRLESFLDPAITNWRGVYVGEMRACLRLERPG